MVQVICEHFGISSGAIEVGCNGQITLRHAFGRGPKFDPDIKDADYNILSAIRKLLARSPVTWAWRHVAGHQDDDGIEELNRWAMLNIEMDNLAKVYWNNISDHQVGNFSITDEYWPACIRGEKIASWLDERIWEHILGSAQCEHWERKGRLTRESISRVNWHACEKAMKSLAIERWNWIAKHVSGLIFYWSQDGAVADAGFRSMPEVWGRRRQSSCLDLSHTRCSVDTDATSFEAPQHIA
jgi:hypothetical protein